MYFDTLHVPRARGACPYNANENSAGQITTTRSSSFAALYTQIWVALTGAEAIRYKNFYARSKRNVQAIDLGVLLSAELGTSVGYADVQLSRALHDILALPRGHIVGDLRGVFPVGLIQVDTIQTTWGPKHHNLCPRYVRWPGRPMESTLMQDDTSDRFNEQVYVRRIRSRASTRVYRRKPPLRVPSAVHLLISPHPWPEPAKFFTLRKEIWDDQLLLLSKKTPFEPASRLCVMHSDISRQVTF